MKNRFSKLIVMLLCISMVLSMTPLTLFAADSAVTTDYYVKPGGTGDGRSASAPAGTLGTVIASINADGHKAGDTVTVHVIRTEEETKTSWQTVIKTTSDGTATTEKDEISSIGFIGYETAVAHTAKIIYEGESETNLSTLVFEKE